MTRSASHSSFENLRNYDSRLRDVVGPSRPIVLTPLQGGLYDVFKQLIREGSLWTSDVADSRDEKAGFHVINNCPNFRWHWRFGVPTARRS